MDFVRTQNGYKLPVEPEILEQLNLKPDQLVSEDVVHEIQILQAIAFVHEMDSRAARGLSFVDTTDMKAELEEMGYRF